MGLRERDHRYLETPRTRYDKGSRKTVLIRGLCVLLSVELLRGKEPKEGNGQSRRVNGSHRTLVVSS